MIYPKEINRESIEKMIYLTRGRVTQYDEPWRSMVVFLLGEVKRLEKSLGEGSAGE